MTWKAKLVTAVVAVGVLAALAVTSGADFFG